MVAGGEDGRPGLVISQLYSLSKGIQSLEAFSSPTLKWNFKNPTYGTKMRALNVHICMEILWKQLRDRFRYSAFNIIVLCLQGLRVGVSCSVASDSL